MCKRAVPSLLVGRSLIPPHFFAAEITLHRSELYEKRYLLKGPVVRHATPRSNRSPLRVRSSCVQPIMDQSIKVEHWTIRSQHKAILSEDENEDMIRWLGDSGGTSWCGRRAGVLLQFPHVSSELTRNFAVAPCRTSCIRGTSLVSREIPMLDCFISYDICLFKSPVSSKVRPANKRYISAYRYSYSSNLWA